MVDQQLFQFAYIPKYEEAINGSGGKPCVLRIDFL